ncbi:hypothetical protein [Sediminitomix flava]|uniref:hypothetical protein n=1 Tax=Sediminitomix flava TaxID=379075 RepID=UPI0011B2902E|nr:hypothetical protein [Sediminitomix flava]
MSTSEQRDILSNRPELKEYYPFIEKVRDSILVSDLDKEPFVNLSYEKVLDFMNRATDTSKFNLMSIRNEKIWIKNNAETVAKIDSIISYWEPFKGTNKAPEVIKTFWKYGKFDTDYRKAEIGRDLIDSNFRSKKEYCLGKVIKILSEYDSLSFDYILRNDDFFNGEPMRYVLDRNYKVGDTPVSVQLVF